MGAQAARIIGLKEGVVGVEDIGQFRDGREELVRANTFRVMLGIAGREFSERFEVAAVLIAPEILRCVAAHPDDGMQEKAGRHSDSE
jgi:hypothetical protein